MKIMLDSNVTKPCLEPISQKDNKKIKQSKHYLLSLSNFDFNLIFNSPAKKKIMTQRKSYNNIKKSEHNSEKCLKLQQINKQQHLLKKQQQSQITTNNQHHIFPKLNQHVVDSHHKNVLPKKIRSQLPLTRPKKQVIFKKLSSQQKIMNKIIKLSHILGVDNFYCPKQMSSRFLLSKKKYFKQKQPKRKDQSTQMQRINTSPSKIPHSRKSLIFEVLGLRRPNSRRKPPFFDKYLKKQQPDLAELRQSKQKHQDIVFIYQKQKLKKKTISNQDQQKSVRGWTKQGKLLCQQIDY